MVQFTIPKKLENEFRPSLTLGCVYMFVDVNTADIKNKKYIYHHQKYMLQFKSSTKVHHLESRGSSIPNYGFEFCPFDQIPSKSRISKPLIGNTCIFYLLLFNYYTTNLKHFASRSDRSYQPCWAI